MLIYEIITEAFSRRDFLRGAASSAVAMALPDIASSGQKVPPEEFDRDPNLRNIWEPRIRDLQLRARAMVKNLIAQAGPRWQNALEGAGVRVKILPGYASAHPSFKLIQLDVTVFWDAPDDTLAFVLAHELGHIAYGHEFDRTQKPEILRQREYDADKFGVALAQSLGYKKAELFKFMHQQEEEYRQLELLQNQPDSTHPAFKDRIRRAKEMGFDLSKGGIEHLEVLKQHLA